MAKITKRDYFNELRAMAEMNDRGDLVEFIDRQIELLDNKSSKKTLTATQKANVGIKDEIYNALVEIGKPVTVSELMAANAEIGARYSNQKLSALLRQLKEEKRVEVSVVKKRSYFSAIAA